MYFINNFETFPIISLPSPTARIVFSLTSGILLSTSLNETLALTLLGNSIPIVFLPGTVTINGVNYPTLNPQNGFNVNFLTMGNTITITYITITITFVFNQQIFD